MTRQELIAAGYPVPDRGGRRRPRLFSIPKLKKVQLEKALEKAGGNRRKAAKMLGIHPVTLWRWIAKCNTLPPKSGDPHRGE